MTISRSQYQLTTSRFVRREDAGGVTIDTGVEFQPFKFDKVVDHFNGNFSIAFKDRNVYRIVDGTQPYVGPTNPGETWLEPQLLSLGLLPTGLGTAAGTKVVNAFPTPHTSSMMVQSTNSSIIFGVGISTTNFPETAKPTTTGTTSQAGSVRQTRDGRVLTYISLGSNEGVVFYQDGVTGVIKLYDYEGGVPNDSGFGSFPPQTFPGTLNDVCLGVTQDFSIWFHELNTTVARRYRVRPPVESETFSYGLTGHDWQYTQPVLRDGYFVVYAYYIEEVDNGDGTKTVTREVQRISLTDSSEPLPQEQMYFSEDTIPSGDVAQIFVTAQTMFSTVGHVASLSMVTGPGPYDIKTLFISTGYYIVSGGGQIRILSEIQEYDDVVSAPVAYLSLLPFEQGAIGWVSLETETPDGAETVVTADDYLTYYLVDYVVTDQFGGGEPFVPGQATGGYGGIGPARAEPTDAVCVNFFAGVSRFMDYPTDGGNDSSGTEFDDIPYVLQQRLTAVTFGEVPQTIEDAFLESDIGGGGGDTPETGFHALWGASQPETGWREDSTKVIIIGLDDEQVSYYANSQEKNTVFGSNGSLSTSPWFSNASIGRPNLRFKQTIGSFPTYITMQHALDALAELNIFVLPVYFFGGTLFSYGIATLTGAVYPSGQPMIFSGSEFDDTFATPEIIRDSIFQLLPPSEGKPVKLDLMLAMDNTGSFSGNDSILISTFRNILLSISEQACESATPLRLNRRDDDLEVMGRKPGRIRTMKPSTSEFSSQRVRNLGNTYARSCASCSKKKIRT